jgi:hypothetical protein
MSQHDSSQTQESKSTPKTEKKETGEKRWVQPGAPCIYQHNVSQETSDIDHCTKFLVQSTD